MNSPDHSTKGTPLGYRHKASVCPPTACGCWVSETLSSPLRGTFHLSLTVLVRYRWPTVLSLGGWSPSFPQDFSCPVVLRHTIPRPCVRRVRASHPLRSMLPSSFPYTHDCPG